MMEMEERTPMRNLNIEFANNSPWYTRKKFIMWIIIAVAVLLAAVALFVGGFFASGYQHTGDSVDTLQSEERTSARPNIQWDGNCPKKASKCPRSFQGAPPPLLLVSLDGFRHDYFERGFTPTINKIAQCGTKADFMYPVFPTKTFPNHFSQVTGLYPSSHGVIDNKMYDPIRKKLFKVGTPESLSPYWWEKEPIWVSAVKQGKKAGCFFWPGSEVKINGTYPTYYKKYNSGISFENRVDQILRWLDMPTQSRPNFLTLYVNQPDNAAHHFGTSSKETNQALAKVDRMIERLYAGLQQRNLIDCVNVIIVSDHGMSDTHCDRVVDIEHFINVNDTFIVAGPFGRLRPKGRRNETFEQDMISKLKCQSDHMRVYAKEQLPVRMHYADNPRIEPIFLDMDAGWTLVSFTAKPNDGICSGGAHGYDNLFPDMRAIFLAQGPAFKKNFAAKPFLNVELYEMFCELIGITPNPNNGTRGSLHYILKSPSLLEAQAEPIPPRLGDVPNDEKEYSFRVYAANCSCEQSRKQVEVEDVPGKKMLHLPFGIPCSPEDNSTLRLLYNNDYVTAFDVKYRLPMWTAFTLTGQKFDKIPDEDLCWRADARIRTTATANCGDYSKSVVKDHYLVPRPLYPPEFSDISVREEATYVTNSVPKSLNHTRVVEKKMYQILQNWTEEFGQLNVLMGPAFDISGSGVRPHIGEIMRLHAYFGPLVVPTHIFIVATWCSVRVSSLNDCHPSQLEAEGFLLPNQPYSQNCNVGVDIIRKNVARVVDIEHLTGLSFYTSLPVYDAIRLRTKVPDRDIW